MAHDVQELAEEAQHGRVKEDPGGTYGDGSTQTMISNHFQSERGGGGWMSIYRLFFCEHQGAIRQSSSLAGDYSQINGWDGKTIWLMDSRRFKSLLISIPICAVNVYITYKQVQVNLESYHHPFPFRNAKKSCPHGGCWSPKKNSSLATKHLGVLAPNLKKMWESPWNHHPTDLGSSQISQNLAGFKYLRIFTFWKHFWDTFGTMAPNHGKFWGVAKSQRPRTSSSSRSPCVAAVLGSTGGAAMASLQRMPRGWCSGSAFGWAKFAWKRDLGSSWIYIPLIITYSLAGCCSSILFGSVWMYIGLWNVYIFVWSEPTGLYIQLAHGVCMSLHFAYCSSPFINNQPKQSYPSNRSRSFKYIDILWYS